jgi:hypothetical protein
MKNEKKCPFTDGWHWVGEAVPRLRGTISKTLESGPPSLGQKKKGTYFFTPSEGLQKTL